MAVVNYDDGHGNDNGNGDEEEEHEEEEEARKQRASVCIKWINSRRRLLQMADELHRASPWASLTGAQDGHSLNCRSYHWIFHGDNYRA